MKIVEEASCDGVVRVFIAFIWLLHEHYRI